MTIAFAILYIRNYLSFDTKIARYRAAEGTSTRHL